MSEPRDRSQLHIYMSSCPQMHKLQLLVLAALAGKSLKERGYNRLGIANTKSRWQQLDKALHAVHACLHNHQSLRIMATDFHEIKGQVNRRVCKVSILQMSLTNSCVARLGSVVPACTSRYSLKPMLHLTQHYFRV